MAKATDTAVKRERKPARSIDDQIAELQAKKDKQLARKQGAAAKKLETVENSIVKTEATLIALLGQRDELRATLGYDEANDVPVTDEPAV